MVAAIVVVRRSFHSTKMNYTVYFVIFSIKKTFPDESEKAFLKAFVYAP